MKLAYFSPMPPAKTGIATYSRHLVAATMRVCYALSERPMVMIA